MASKVPKNRQIRPKKTDKKQILGLEQEKELEELLKEGQESDDEDMRPPKQLEGMDAPLIFLRQHGQRHKELQRFDLKKVGKIVKTVVEVQMLRQDKAAQRLDGIDKTWALERLEHVSLVQLELKKIDARIGNMTSLHTADFSNNHLHDGSFPPEMANCERLRHIKLNDNRLTQIPETFASVKNLSKLDIRQNRICTVKGLKSLTNLVGVNLSHNRLLLFDLGMTQGDTALRHLEYINCSHNHITAITTDLTLLPKLEEVNFSHNGLRYLTPSLLQSSSLTKVNIAANYIFKIKAPISPSAAALPLHPSSAGGGSGGRRPRGGSPATPVAVAEKKATAKFVDLSHNQLTRFPEAVPSFADDVALNHNRIRFIKSTALEKLKGIVSGRKEIDLTSNPLTCFHGAKALASPQQQSAAQNIIGALQLLRFLFDYDEQLENCLYRGMKLVVIGPSGSGKKEFLEMMMADRSLDFRQRIVEHSLRMRHWMTVSDYYLNVYFGGNKTHSSQPSHHTSSSQQQQQAQTQSSQQKVSTKVSTTRPTDHRIVHSSMWKFSGSITKATMDFFFIRHEQMIVNLVVNLLDYSPEYQYEILGLWIDMTMTYSQHACIIIPVGMFGEELASEKDAVAFSRMIEKYLSSFISFREKELKQTLDDMEAVGEAKLSLISGAKLRTLRSYKSRLPLIHENLVRISLPGAKGADEYLNLVKAACFHPSFFGQYVRMMPGNLIDCLQIIDDYRHTLELPMVRFRDLSALLSGVCGRQETAVLEMAADLHESGSIFWLGKNRTIGDHSNDVIFVDVQWLVDALYCMMDRETVQQMAAQVKSTQVFEDVGIEQCEAYIDRGVMSVDILKRLWKSLMPEFVVKHDTLQQLIVTLMASFKIGYPTHVLVQSKDPTEIPKGKFIVNTDHYKVEWMTNDGKGDSKMECAYYQIPYLVVFSIPPEVDTYLRGLGLLGDEGASSGGTTAAPAKGTAKGQQQQQQQQSKQQRPEFLGAEFYFPIFCPRGLFHRVVAHLAQTLKSVLFVSLWKDGVWARSGDGSCGLLVQSVTKESFKVGPAPSERMALRLFCVDLKAGGGGGVGSTSRGTPGAGGDAQSVCNRLWTYFVTILKETEAIFLWFPGLFYLSYSLCPHCRNPACPGEWHDGRDLVKTKSLKCKSCNKDVQTHYLLKTA